MYSYQKPYALYKTLPDLVNEVVAELTIASEQGDQSCLETLQDIKKLVEGLQDRFCQLFKDLFPLYNTEISYLQLKRGEITLCLKFLPDPSKSTLTKLLFQYQQPHIMEFGFMRWDILETGMQFVGMEPIGRSLFGKTPIGHLYPCLCHYFMKVMENGCEHMSAVLDYLGEMSEDQQSALKESLLELFPDADHTRTFGRVAITQLPAPGFQQTLWDELEVIQAAQAASQ
jgi:hypothetical protein